MIGTGNDYGEGMLANFISSLSRGVGQFIGPLFDGFTIYNSFYRDESLWNFTYACNPHGPCYPVIVER